MTASSVATLVLIAVVAVVAPLLSELTGKLAIPEIVFQIGLGMLLGPYVLNIAHLSSVVTGLSDLEIKTLREALTTCRANVSPPGA